MNKTLNKKFNTDLKYVYSDNDTLSIIFQNNEVLLGVVGEFNNNIKELENITKTNIYSRGNSILVKSTPQNNELVKNAIKALSKDYEHQRLFFESNVLFNENPQIRLTALTQLLTYEKNEEIIDLIKKIKNDDRNQDDEWIKIALNTLEKLKN